MKMTKLIALFALLFTAAGAQAQMFIFDDDFDQSNPLNCDSLSQASATNFVDMGGNYMSNMDETITFCPDLTQGSKVSISFGTNIGFEFDIHPSDTMYIYDGPNTSSPLIGAYNSGTDPSGFYVSASFENNPSGCITVRFVSDAANEGTGWIANVACGNLPQPFVPHLEAFYGGTGPNIINPIDTGYINMCFGDSVLLVAKPLFPYSLENTGTGYAQNADNAIYTWTIGGVGVIPGNNDSIWFTPPARQGYFIDVRIMDPFPQPARITCKIRVSQLPIFAGTGPVEDTVCLGLNTELIGGVTATDTVGVEVPGGSFNIGGTFAGLTALPDGSNALYETTIGMTGLGTNATITDGNDISSICLDIEHSFIGDLEIALTCPNGTTVSLMNTFGGAGMIPGGCSGGGIFLGNDNNMDGGAPGSPVWTYCFSAVNATAGTICNELGNTVPNAFGFQAIDPANVYLPDGNFDDFIGCPLNGPWTISVKDNQSVDDGYIFQWGILFDASLYPDPEAYQNTIVSDYWDADPTIVTGQSDTAIVVIPTASGPHNYTYHVTDDFGCEYDTTVVLFTVPQPTIFADTTACYYTFFSSGTTAYNGGVWSAVDTCIHFSSTTALNPVIYSSVAGVHTVTFTDNTCGTSVSADIWFPAYVYTQVLDTAICEGSTYTINALQSPDITNYTWNNGQTGPAIDVSGPGDYIVTVNNICHSWTDTATITMKVCDILAPNVVILGSKNGNNMFYVDYEGVTKFECTIVNRWGNTIYEYIDPAGGWDGRDKSGNVVEEGVYFYTIKAKMEGNLELKKQGFIQLYH